MLPVSGTARGTVRPRRGGIGTTAAVVGPRPGYGRLLVRRVTAHVLLGGEGEITGVLDWTTARVDDPARDLAAQHGAAGEEMLRVTVAAYEEAGGQAHAGLAAQARHLWDASPIGYALHALTTGADADREAAAALLDQAAP